jgi:diguanylate cyclase (GGDEF)-like protein
VSLIQRAMLVVSVVTLISLSVSLAGRHFLVIPELERVEATADHKDIDRVLLGIEVVESKLSQVTYDNAVWDDTMVYFSNRDPDYIRRNFNLQTFVIHRVNLILIVDNEGDVLWSNQVDLTSESYVEPDSDLVTMLIQKSSQALSRSPEKIVVKARYAGRPHPITVAISRVLNTDETGVSPGVLIVGRFLDNTVREEVSRAFNVDFTWTVKAEDLAFYETDIESLRRGENQQIEWAISDSLGQPMLNVVSHLGVRGFDDGLFPTPVALSTLAVILIWALVFYLLRHFLISPIVQVAMHLVSVRKSGDYSLRIGTAHRSDEIGVLNEECNALLHHVEEQADSLTRLSRTDGLTQIANRRYFDETLQKQWTLHMRTEESMGLLLCDIDFFKPYNDNYGHPAGDKALQIVGKALANSAHRDSDLVARVGGEEFALLLPATDLEGCKTVARRVLEAVLSLDITHQHCPLGRVSISVGVVSTVPPRNTASKGLYVAADKALYAAKENGRARLEVATFEGEAQASS